MGRHLAGVSASTLCELARLGLLLGTRVLRSAVAAWVLLNEWICPSAGDSLSAAVPWGTVGSVAAA